MPKAVIFGSAPLGVKGVDIREDIDELDLFVSGETFDGLIARGWTARCKMKDKSTGEDVLHIVVAGEHTHPTREIFKTFQGVSFEDVYAHSVPHISGFRMGDIQDVRQWKMFNGRDKDIRDVESITRFLRRGS